MRCGRLTGSFSVARSCRMTYASRSWWKTPASWLRSTSRALRRSSIWPRFRTTSRASCSRKRHSKSTTAARVRTARLARDGRGATLHPSVVVQHLWVPAGWRGCAGEQPDESADHLRPRQRDGGEGRAAARGRRLLRSRAAAGDRLRPCAKDALRPCDQRHDVRGLEDRPPAPHAGRHPVAAHGSRAGRGPRTDVSRQGGARCSCSRPTQAG